MTRRVRLTIDHLVLDGVAAKDRAAVIRALEQGLAARLREAAPGESRSHEALSLTMRPASARPADLGRAAARAVSDAVRGKTP